MNELCISRGFEDEGILELGLDGRRKSYKNQSVAIT